MNAKRKALAERILRLVREGQLVCDGKLPTERELVDILQESRQLVREAVIALEAWGFLEVRERQGIFVKAVDGADLTQGLDSLIAWPEDILPQAVEMRRIVEVPAAALAATRRSDEDVARLRACLDQLFRLSNAEGERDVEEGTHWNSLLHGTIVQAARNVLLLRVHEGLVGITERVIVPLRRRRIVEQPLLWSKRVFSQHQRIVEAIAGQNPEAAMAAMEEHLDGTSQGLREFDVTAFLRQIG
ncbi:FadR family transcriptional regulator [Aminithiophilus ramosus]|uniref:FadR family transcriptional regulator n=2 Tax=Synergistales TaxID=649776 RepID=A0A9Q7EYJ3_9BACT|nr:FCD domain-containing protein [Aminithiophilus ramosus]QTX32066.1 FadR family transcriptional regulator [Aminithiophilus ramosus]QVL35932.1 FadR family transcriptional regulator [Synergistota bacterium]